MYHFAIVDDEISLPANVADQITLSNLGKLPKTSSGIPSH
jgi:hypothetical protein